MRPVCNKFENLFDLLARNLDIITIAGAKLDSRFSKIIRKNIDSQSGSLLVYIKSEFFSKLLTKYLIPKDMQLIPYDVNLRKAK